MDIYFCDECGSRVTDLDLRAGRGMRKRYDTICAGCVHQGLADAWLARADQPVAAGVAAIGGKVAAVAVAEAPNLISVARDRARTQPDDPFSVDEPTPLKPRTSSGPETDAIPAVKSSARQTPHDDLAAAGGGFGALIGSALPTPPAGLVDDPIESSHREAAAAAGFEIDKGIEVSDVPPIAKADSPFDFVHPKDNNNPGKSETEEVAAIGAKDETRAEERPARTASGRQTSQKRSSTASSKRSPAKAASTRRSGSARAQGNKVILFSVISCVVMLIIFSVVVLNRGSGGKRGGEIIRDEPLTNLQGTIDEAKRDSGDAMGTDDAAKVDRAIASVRRMQASFLEFQRRAKNWDEDAHGEQLRRMGYYDVQATLRDLNNRKVILEQRAKP